MCLNVRLKEADRRVGKSIKTPPDNSAGGPFGGMGVLKIDGPDELRRVIGDGL